MSVVGRTIKGYADFPSLNFLGRDLLTVKSWRRAVSVTTPFLLTITFFVFAAYGLWIGSIACTMLLTFLTYGSISHDLVHGTLPLPRAVNETLLCASSWFRFAADTPTALFISIIMLISRRPMISKELRQV